MDKYIDKENCTNCPLRRRFDTCNVDSLVIKNNIKEAISIVEECPAAHPRKTRQDIFLKQYPNCMIDHDGVVGICPKNVDNKRICDLELFMIVAADRCAAVSFGCRRWSDEN